MPEGDTVWRTAHRLDEALAGRVITSGDFRWPSLATVDLRGATTLEVVSLGKHILQRLDTGVTLHSHLRMEGQWRIDATSTIGPRHLRGDTIRAVVGNDRWTAIGLRLGMLDLVDTVAEDTLVGHLGPDILGPDWDVDRAVANLRGSPTMAIGQALMDQRHLAGIGTLYAAESLFLQRQPPWQPVGEISDDALLGLIERARRLLDLNCQNAVPTTTARPRRGERTWVHALSGRPCRRCGGPVRVASIGPAPLDRPMFYCPACQGGLGPTDDGRPQRPLGASLPRR